jgi:hypothetical protein
MRLTSHDLETAKRLARLFSCFNQVRHLVSEVRQRRRTPDRFEADSWLIPNENPNGMERA